MPYPAAPEIATSYTAQEQALGNGTLPGQELDVDLASIRASVTAVIEFVKGITRSDGALANGIVTREALGAALIIGFDTPSVWATGVAYTTRSIVFEGAKIYLCLVAHTSSVFATDLASGRWSLLADLTPPAGALVASNNLSDLPNVPTARANLGLGSMATAFAGIGASDFRTNSQNEAFFQPLDTDLTAIAGLTSAADQLPYFTGPGTAALAAFTAAGRALVDDADAAAQRTTLGAQAALGFTPVEQNGGVGHGNNKINLGWDSISARLTVDGLDQGRLIRNVDTVAGSNGALFAPGDAPLYAARAWVNFNGTGTVAIRASGNVSSITDNGVGDYTINFTTAMPDANFATSGAVNLNNSDGYVCITGTTTTGQVRVITRSSGAFVDALECSVAIFR